MKNNWEKIKDSMVLLENAQKQRWEKYTFPQVEVQILVFKNTLVKVEVLTKLLYSSKSKEGFEMYFSKKYP